MAETTTLEPERAEEARDHRSELDGRWHRGEDVSTEDLRQSLQSYRSFFDRLLRP